MLGKCSDETADSPGAQLAVGCRWMPLNAAVTYTSRSASTLRRAVEDGLLPRHQPDGPGTKLYFTAGELDAYMSGDRRERDGQGGDEGRPKNENAPAAATVGG